MELNPEPIPEIFSIPSIKTLSLTANGFDENNPSGVDNLHV